MTRKDLLIKLSIVRARNSHLNRVPYETFGNDLVLPLENLNDMSWKEKYSSDLSVKLRNVLKLTDNGVKNFCVEWNSVGDGLSRHTRFTKC